MRKTICCAVLAAACGCASVPPEPPAPTAPLQPAVRSMLLGDALEAIRQLDAIDAPLTAKQRTFAECMRARFQAPLPAAELPASSAAILAAYQQYWRDAMTKADTVEAVEARLVAALDAIPATRGATLDTMSDRVVAAVQADGLHALTGKTAPFFELMIWKSEETRIYDVTLPEGPVNVKVVFLDKFASLGWTGFATCEIAHTGGWAKSDALFAVRSAYDLDSETFRVSYLAHEGQHFADYGHFPALEQPELEYRAKLTEIAVSTATTAALVSRFAATGGDSRSVPHAFANRKVALALEGVPAERVREAARAKLLESSETLKRLGPATTKKFLD